jgi:hypothetical protein
MGNEDQDTVTLLEEYADVDKMVTRLPEAQGTPWNLLMV